MRVTCLTMVLKKMLEQQFKYICLVSFVLVSSICHGDDVADATKAYSLAKSIDERDLGYKSSRAQMTMTISKSSGESTVRKLRVDMLEGDSGDSSILTFEFPADIRGTALLSKPNENGDDQWLFMPAINRVKRISSRNKSGSFVGSEFSFEDLSDKQLDDFKYEYGGMVDCDIEVISEGATEMLKSRCDMLVRHPVDKHTGYSKQVLKIDADELRILSIEYFDVRGSLLKRLVSEKFKLFDDRFWRPLKVVMYNEQSKKSTTLEYESLVFDAGLVAKDFNRSALSH